MSDFLEIHNHGPLITGSNYWDSELAAEGFAYLSLNAGAFRLLVPSSRRSWIADMRKGCRYIQVRMLPTAEWQPNRHVAEWLSEDDSDAPWCLRMSAGQVDRCPPADDADREWLASVWILKRGKPHKVFERLAYFKRVSRF